MNMKKFASLAMLGASVLGLAACGGNSQKEASASKSDAAKTEKETPGVLAVREYIKKLHGFKSITIIEQEKNLGLANSIIQGVTATVKKYGRAIVLEDDIETSPYFLQFMNEALDLYSNIKNSSC